ncbi:MAG: hypothetical protein ACI8SE_001804 [Bacteroidia bacterium]
MSTIAIDANGYYEFLNLNPETYSVLISITEGTAGTSAQSLVLPSKWENTGEFVGTGQGSDSGTDGVLYSITINVNFIENVNFGIQKTPESYDKSTQISVPSLGDIQALVSSNDFPALLGSDYEDGDLGTTYALVVTDTSDMNGNELYYDVRFPLNTTLPNFDPTLLTVKFVGLNSSTFAFDCYFVDKADAIDETPATYQASWSEPLPVEWIGFDVNLNSAINAVQIEWSTAQEENNSHFIVQRAELNGDFIEVGMIE